jgi:hypothetical protein
MNKLLRIFFLILFSSSCSSDLDFDQVDDFKAEPVLVANLASFDIQANQFIIGGAEQPLVGDVMDFKVFDDPDFSSKIKKTDFFFEFKNTINRGFVVNMFLLDANDVRLYTIPFTVPAYTGSPIVVSTIEVFENASLDILKQTKKIGFLVGLLPGPPLTNTSAGSLKLRSSGTFYFVL